MAEAGGDSTDRYALRAQLRAAHLAQGAPTSPALANLVCFGLDTRLTGYANRLGATYNRYADDLTLSGGASLRDRVPTLVAAVERMVGAEGFALNRFKTRVEYRGGSAARHRNRGQRSTGHSPR